MKKYILACVILLSMMPLLAHSSDTLNRKKGVLEKKRLQESSCEIIIDYLFIDKWRLGHSPLYFKERYEVTKKDRLLLTGSYFVNLEGIDTPDISISWAKSGSGRDYITAMMLKTVRVRTADNLRVGNTKQEVLEILGLPHGSGDNYIKYWTNETETYVIIFELDDSDVVTRIQVYFTT